MIFFEYLSQNSHFLARAFADYGQSLKVQFPFVKSASQHYCHISTVHLKVFLWLVLLGFSDTETPLRFSLWRGYY